MKSTDVIPLRLFRSVIQDLPEQGMDTFYADGTLKTFQLSNYPVQVSSVVRVTVEDELVADFSLDPAVGTITFLVNPTGTLRVEYQFTQLSDTELEMCLDMALLRHDRSASWDRLPPHYPPFLQMLAAASAYYMLAAKWARRTRIKVESTETHFDKVGTKYLTLAQTLEQRYYEACAGVIDIITVTRFDVFTGQRVPIVEV